MYVKLFSVTEVGVKTYYEVFLTEDAKKLFPDVDRYYIDKYSYFQLTKNA